MRIHLLFPVVRSCTVLSATVLSATVRSAAVLSATVLSATVSSCTPCPTPQPTEAESGSTSGGVEVLPEPDGDTAFQRVIGDLASAFESGDAELFDALADPEFGLWLWGVPGCCSSPLAQHVPETRPAFELAEPHPNLDFATIATVLKEALAVATVDPEPYQVPEEPAIETAAPWGGLLLHPDRLRLRGNALIAEDAEPDVSTNMYLVTHEFQAEHGYNRALVYLRKVDGRFHVMHVLFVVHYDA